jgi:hypothetical protein
VYVVVDDDDDDGGMVEMQFVFVLLMKLPTFVVVLPSWGCPDIKSSRPKWRISRVPTRRRIWRILSEQEMLA